jgi:hypothetical protein
MRRALVGAAIAVLLVGCTTDTSELESRVATLEAAGSGDVVVGKTEGCFLWRDDGTRTEWWSKSGCENLEGAENRQGFGYGGRVVDLTVRTSAGSAYTLRLYEWLDAVELGDPWPPK